MLASLDELGRAGAPDAPRQRRTVRPGHRRALPHSIIRKGGSMTAWTQREYTDIAELRGPLLIVRGVAGVGWDEFATIRSGSGESAARSRARG